MLVKGLKLGFNVGSKISHNAMERSRNPIIALLLIAICAARLIAFVLSSSSGPVCVSQGGRFPKFSREGRPPHRSLKGREDLTLCRIYRKRTCCTSSQTNAALSMLKRLAVFGEGKFECLSLWEVLECSICDPQIGIHAGPPILCASFCSSLFQACGDVFFSMDSTNQFLVPCGSKDIICAQGWNWTSTSFDFCRHLGFRVETQGLAMGYCFDGKYEGKASTDQVITHEKIHTYGRWKAKIGEKDMSEKILWAVGGLVLTALAAFYRYRKIQSKQKKLAAFIKLKQSNFGKSTVTNMDAVSGMKAKKHS